MDPKHKLGLYLKEVSFSFLLRRKLIAEKAEKFIHKIIKAIDIHLVHLEVNNLYPGFDIVCTIKESMLYLGYWYEVDLIRLHVFSCKKFDETKVLEEINRFFKTNGKVKMEINRDKTITEEILSCL